MPTRQNPRQTFKPNRSSSEVRLVCFPYAGGAATEFRQWIEELPATLEPLPVEYPGRGSRFKEAPLRSVIDLAHAAAQALEPFCVGPYVLFGHSLGALVAFEVSRLLRKRGQAPLHLFVSGSRAPHSAALEPPTYSIPPAAFYDRLRGWGGIPAEFLGQPQLLAMVEPILRADLEAAETYRCSPPQDLRIPITAFAGMSDPLAPPTLAAEWSAYTSGYFALRLIPGDHFFLSSRRSLLLGMIVRELELAADHGPAL